MVQGRCPDAPTHISEATPHVDLEVMEPEKKRSKTTQHMLSEMEPFYVGVFADSRSWGTRVHDLVRHGSVEGTCQQWSPDDFRVAKIVGQGYFGTVLRATAALRRDEPTREVALKRVSKARIIKAREHHDTHPQLELLRNEVLIHSSICHRNILPFHGFFEDMENFCFVLALAPYGNVAEWMYVEERPRAAVAPLVVSSMARAFSYLHEHRIAHRDLKPENILVFGPNHFCLGDFGSACMGDLNRLTLTGTPEFLAPEVVDRTTYYNAILADRWALGVLMYELAYGSNPFACDESRDDDDDDFDVGAHTERCATFTKIRNFREPVAAPGDCSVSVTGILVQNFCNKLMKISPMERMTPEEALQHPILQSIDPRVDTTSTPSPSSSPKVAVTTSPPPTWSDGASDSEHRTPPRRSGPVVAAAFI